MKAPARWTPGFRPQGQRDPERSGGAARATLYRDKMPVQMELPFALWTAQAVREPIQEKLDKTLGLSTTRLYLKRWGFASRKPLTRATQRDPQKIAAWL